MKEQAIKLEKSFEIQILHFNDVYDIEPNNFGQYGFLNFYSKYQELLKIYPESLTVFSGDAFAPSKLSKLFKGQQMVNCLNMLQIDVACYGNHEFDYPIEHTTELAKMCDFPWLLANVRNKQTKNLLGDAEEFIILQRGVFKIGFFGLAGPDFKGRLISSYKEIVAYEDHIQCAKRICGILKKNKCNLIIAITHMRVPPDQNLAKKVPLIDLILGGHDHFQLCKIVDKTPILKSGKNFEKIGLYKVRKDKPQRISKGESLHQGKKWWFINQCLSVPKTKNPDPKVQSYVSSVLQKWNKRGIAENIKKKEIKASLSREIPQWKLSYDLVNGKIVAFIQSNNSSEICFAKYVAFQKRLHFGGILPGKCFYEQNEDFVQQSLKQICKLANCKYSNSKWGIISEGFDCIPYFIECCNMLYLPSSFDFIFDSIKQIEKVLSKASQTGIRCNAIIQKSKLVHCSKQRKFGCRIQLVHIPQTYKQILQNCNIKTLIKLQQIAHTVKLQEIKHRSDEQNKNTILIQFEDRKYLDYYHLLQCISFWKINHKPAKSSQLAEMPPYLFDLLKTIYDFPFCKDQLELINNLISTHKMDIDKQFFIKQQSLEMKLRKENCEVYIFSLQNSHSSDIQYMNSFFSTVLGRQYIENQTNLVKDEDNNTLKGIVFNDFLISNPTYELGYGYLPILFTQGRVLKKLDKLLTQGEAKLKKWVNIYEQNRNMVELITLSNEKQDCEKPLIISNRWKSFKTAEWVTKYATKSQWNNKFIDASSILLTIKKLTVQLQK